LTPVAFVDLPAQACHYHGVGSCKIWQLGLNTETNAMLLGLPPILGPDLLFTLRAMGHGDEIALVDGNYPAQEHARRLIRADGHGLMPLLHAILHLLPIDEPGAGQPFPAGIYRASLNNDPAQSGPIHQAIDQACAARGLVVAPLSGAELYPRIRAAHTVVATSEMALFANVILRKGVIRSTEEPPAVV
jgi:L-fucose mutarotase